MNRISPNALIYAVLISILASPAMAEVVKAASEEGHSTIVITLLCVLVSVMAVLLWYFIRLTGKMAKDSTISRAEFMQHVADCSASRTKKIEEVTEHAKAEVLAEWTQMNTLVEDAVAKRLEALEAIVAEIRLDRKTRWTKIEKALFRLCAGHDVLAEKLQIPVEVFRREVKERAQALEDASSFVHGAAL